ncbi:hypothetical protein AgCh_010535 [Apium graveolens]
MTSRSKKRKRWSGIKNVAEQELQNLAITCADFNNDMEEAKIFYSEMYATMENMQSELFARSVGLEEKFNEIENTLKNRSRKKCGESSQSSIEIPHSYTGNSLRFLDIGTPAAPDLAVQVGKLCVLDF